MRKLTQLDVLTIVFANLSTMVLAISFNWGIGSLILVYWWQSVIIGFFYVIELKKLPEAFYQKLLSEQKDQALTRVRTYRNSIVYGYTIFYALVMLFIGLVLTSAGINNDATFSSTSIAVSLFFFNHLFSYLKFRDTELQLSRSFREVVYAPYFRALPMLLTVMVGGYLVGFDKGSTGIEFLIVFVIIKTVIDIRQHLREHKYN